MREGVKKKGTTDRKKLIKKIKRKKQTKEKEKDIDKIV